MFIRVHHASWQLPDSARCGARRRRLGPHRQTQSLGSVDWGVTGEWGRVSWALLIASLLNLHDMHCTRACRARACSCIVCFSAGYILPELRKVNFICAKWSFDPQTVRVRGCFPSSDPRTDRFRRKNCGSESAVDRDRRPHNTDLRWAKARLPFWRDFCGLKMFQNANFLGLCPGPCWGSLQRSPRPLSW